MNTLVSAVLAHGKEHPDKLALGFKDTRISYSALSRAVKSLAAALRSEYGIKAGDRVMLSAVSKPDYVIALLAAQFLGATTVPVDRSAKEEALAELCGFVRPALFLTDAKIRAEIARAAPLKALVNAALTAEGTASIPYSLPDGNDIAEILFTTGTTGKPKGGMLSWKSIEASMENTWHGVGMLADDVILLPLPLQHSFGMRVLRSALYIGATVVLQNGFVFVQDLEKNLADFKCTALVSVPASLETLYAQLGEQKFAELTRPLRYIEVSAGAVRANFRLLLVRLLPHTRIVNTWGSTETGGAVFWTSDDADRPGSLGKLIAGVEMRALDTEGNVAEARDVSTAGRMALRGAMQMAGYFENPEATSAAIVDGWLLTNDLVYTDADGYIYMLGRADDIINVGGEKVSPVEVENVASQCEHVRECACIGVDDGVFGKVPVLYVVADGAFDKKDCERFLQQRLERYKLPHEYVLVGSLPRNRMQKIDRKELVRWWAENGTAGNALSNEVISAIMRRRSIREFTEQAIPRNMLETLVRCGMYAPSGHNMQTWHFTVITDAARIAELKEKAERACGAKDGAYFYGFVNPAACIMVSEDRRNHYALQDGSAATQNIMLAAHSLGLGSVWVNGIIHVCDESEMRAFLTSLGVPENHIIVSTICMGWPKNGGKELAKKQDVVSWV